MNTERYLCFLMKADKGFCFVRDIVSVGMVVM